MVDAKGVERSSDDEWKQDRQSDDANDETALDQHESSRLGSIRSTLEAGARSAQNGQVSSATLLTTGLEVLQLA